MTNVKISLRGNPGGQAFLRKQKMMLVLPAIVIPFLTLAFWALGGGKSNTEKNSEMKNLTGLNLHLPDPKLKKESPLDKLGFYDKAYRDSLKFKEQMRNDPFYQEQIMKEEESGSPNELSGMAQSSAGRFQQSVVDADRLNTSPYNTSTNQSEQKLMQKLAELDKAINQPTMPATKKADYSSTMVNQSVSHSNTEQMKHIMQSMNQPDDNDPELDKLSSMMDKIIDIQHPERIKIQLEEKSLQQGKSVFMVCDKAEGDTISDGFFGLDMKTEIKKSNAIEAVVNDNQVLVNGSVIKLRLLSDAYIKNVKIPAGNFVFGIAALNGERLEVQINSIRIDNSIYPVKMEVYDMDGLAGIYIPGAISRDIAKQSADNSLQTMQLTALDPSLTGQATAAGIGTVKNLISKKVKQVKVMVKAGYKILLKDASS
ncbi:MAG: conjugative transposon protein TraM [Ginsengibacter sp.]